jgi:hypothetical protein
VKFCNGKNVPVKSGALPVKKPSTAEAPLNLLAWCSKTGNRRRASPESPTYRTVAVQMRICVRSKPLGALADIFQIIANHPPVTVDENLEKTAIGFGPLDKSSLHSVHDFICLFIDELTGFMLFLQPGSRFPQIV